MIAYKKSLVLLGDMIALCASFLLTILISFPNNFGYQINLHIEPFILLYFIWILIIYIFNLYDNQNIRPTVLTAQKITLAFIVCGVLGISMFYLFPIFSISPKSNLFINLILFGIFFISIRRFLSIAIINQLSEKVAILGITKESSELYESFLNKNALGYKAITISESIDEILNHTGLNKIIIAKNIDTNTLMKITKKGIQTETLLQAYEKTYEKIPVSLMNENITVEILSKNKNIFYNFFSIILGLVIGLIVIIATLPISLISSLIIKIEDGRKIFYKQKRVGKNHKNFMVFKFQSMKENAEKGIAVWAEEKDPRITKFGKIMRKLHIDEIPQMINIIKGDIAIVGPRPERPEFVEKLEKEIPYYFLRHSIKPGFTGWAQIKYRYARTIDDSKDKFEYDLYYLKNRNIFLDIGIILKTVQIIFTH